MLNDTDFVKYVAENYSYLVAEAVRKLEGISVEQYLALVKKHYGDGVMGDLLTALSGDLMFTKKFVLNEHHLYGSSRLGVKTHKRVLLRKEFSISGFEEDGSYSVDNVTDSFAYVRSNEYFCRVLAQKQYELSNHLGNVLATVLDRRTGVFDPIEDTLMYYEADVVNATLYYPFGSAMMSYKDPDFSFAYAFNGMERDDETGLTDFGARFYSEKYGRFISRDEMEANLCSQSTYTHAANNPIYLIDKNGRNPEPAPYLQAGLTFRYIMGGDNYLGIYKQVAWKQHQSLPYFSMEAALRTEIGIYSKMWGVSGFGWQGNTSLSAGFSFGKDITPTYRGLGGQTFQSQGTMVGTLSNSFTIGWNETFIYGSRINNESVAQNIGGFYGRYDWRTGSILFSHLNDMFGDGGDEQDGANGFLSYTNFGSNNPWRIMYSFRIVNPEANLNENGRRESKPYDEGSDRSYYIFSNSEIPFYSSSLLTFDFMFNNQQYSIGIGSLGGITQEFWQNRLAHGNGNIFPRYDNPADNATSFSPFTVTISTNTCIDNQ